MKKRLALLLASLGIMVLCIAPAVSVAAVDPFEGVCTERGTNNSPACGASGKNPLTGKDGVLYKVTRVIAFISGITAVIIIIIAGFMYVTSGGDSGKVNKAKQTIIYAVVGLLVILLAQAIISFVLTNVKTN